MKDSLDASTLQSPGTLRLPAALGRNVASQALTAAKRAFNTGSTFGAASGALDFLVNIKGIAAVVTGVDDSTEGHGGEEEGS
ncbi:hypothetical protein DPV78_005610 [Talaromyces pinophilus]|nr:hypothetical protein DPV78_005610 [Talaromyces pinophilus]